MTDLCDLLRQVLGKETQTDIQSLLAEMISDLTGISVMMARYTVAMEAKVPAAKEIRSLVETQQELRHQLDEQGRDLKWLREKLSQRPFQP